MNKRIIVIGLGGIGSFLLSGLCPFVNYSKTRSDLILVDGDKYEPHNHTRQSFTELGPKAEVQAAWISRAFPELSVTPIARYVSANGEKGSQAIDQVVLSGDVVFSCVDNHRTRKLIGKHCGTLDNSILISGGNELSDGNLQIFVRSKGENLTPTIEKYHPEIQHPKDKAPFQMSCEEAAVSTPQLLFANMQCAILMLNAFYSLGEGKLNLEESEVYFDLLENRVVPRKREK